MYYLINIIISNEKTNEDTIFDFKYIFLGNTINNRILENGKFTRIYYSTPLCSFNGIYLLLELDDILESNLNNTNNNKILINIEKNKVLIEQIKKIEQTILDVINIKNKTQTCNIYTDFLKGYLRLNYRYNITKIILKISGIWETNNTYGLSFKYSYIKQYK